MPCGSGDASETMRRMGTEIKIKIKIKIK